jgi:hypothetical protein
LAFLGWTGDGTRFAMRASYGNKLSDGDRPANYVELVHVGDGITGEIESSYVVDRVASASVPADDPLARAAVQARSSERWLERRVALLLQPPDARRAPRRRGELRLQLLDVPGRTRVLTQPKRGGFDVAWWGFEHDAAVTGAPRVQLAWNDEDGRTVVLDEAFAVGNQQLAAVASSREVAFRTEVRVFWSPDETRCVVTFDGRTDPAEVNLADRRWFMGKL